MITIKEIKAEEYKGNFNLIIIFSDYKFQQISIMPDSSKKEVARSLHILAENIERNQMNEKR